ncbi:MAG: hypothetical protein ACRDYX_11650 [Egibacteraceae bacterium]
MADSLGLDQRNALRAPGARRSTPGHEHGEHREHAHRDPSIARPTG